MVDRLLIAAAVGALTLGLSREIRRIRKSARLFGSVSDQPETDLTAASLGRAALPDPVGTLTDSRTANLAIVLMIKSEERRKDPEATHRRLRRAAMLKYSLTRDEAETMLKAANRVVKGLFQICDLDRLSRKATELGGKTARQEFTSLVTLYGESMGPPPPSVLDRARAGRFLH